MKRNMLCKVLSVMVVLFTLSGYAQAQDLKSLLSGVAKAVIGDKATHANSIIGTWQYSAPKCQFESEKFLSKAGGDVAANQVEEKIKPIYDKLNLENCEYTFNEDGTYQCIQGKRTTKGTYTFDDKTKAINMKTRLGIKSTAYVSVVGKTMNLVFKADKLMDILKAVSGAAGKVSKVAAGLNKLSEEYDGMMLGFELHKK